MNKKYAKRLVSGIRENLKEGCLTVANILMVPKKEITELCDMVEKEIKRRWWQI